MEELVLVGLLTGFGLLQLLLTTTFRHSLARIRHYQSKHLKNIGIKRRTSFKRCSAPIMVSIVASDIPLICSVKKKKKKGYQSFSPIAAPQGPKSPSN